MKVLMINGSCNKNGCTYTALSEIAKVLNEENIETEIIQTGNAPIRDCIGCGACQQVCPAPEKAMTVHEIEKQITLEA